MKKSDESWVFYDRRDTVFIRFIAIILITNSHLDRLYPMPALGTGGAIGNALFFMLSGYGLIRSWQKEPRAFYKWYTRRILRIYPSLILVIIIFNLLMGGAWKSWMIRDYLANFIWPTPAWFIGALMGFYIIFYWLVRLKKQTAFVAAILLLFVPYFYFYFTCVDLSRYTIEGPGYFKWVFYFQIMLFGGYLAYRPDRIGAKNPMVIIYLAAALLFYLICGKSFLHGVKSEFQFLIHLLTFAIVTLVLSAARSKFILINIMGNKKIAAGIGFIAGLTLEIYLIQFYVYSSKIVTSQIFPLNIIVFWILVIFLSFIVFKVSGCVRNFVNG